MENRRDILDHDVINPHHPTRRPGQIQPHMAVNGRRAPDHIHPRPIARGDDGADRHHLPIARQRHIRPHLIGRAHVVARAVPGPSGNSHAGQRPADRLHPRSNPQIQPRLKRNLLKRPQLLRGGRLLQLQTARKILIGRHKTGIGLARIAALPRPPILARPQPQPRRKRRRHQDQTLGNRLVHSKPREAKRGVRSGQTPTRCHKDLGAKG